MGEEEKEHRSYQLKTNQVVTALQQNEHKFQLTAFRQAFINKRE